MVLIPSLGALLLVVTSPWAGAQAGSGAGGVAAPAARTNRLAAEASPFLLRHADDAVDWLPWGAEVRARARREDKPVLLSIGYSACRWSERMERECFEDPELARLLNEGFVCALVDRDERPDVDALYQAALGRLAGGGGWPATLFLTPELAPFHGATYLPARADREGPGLAETAQRVLDLWASERARARRTGALLLDDLGGGRELARGAAPPDRSLLARAVGGLRSAYDPRWGGFGAPGSFAPKFPRAPLLVFLLRESEATNTTRTYLMARTGLDRMAEGGLRDPLDGGFRALRDRPRVGVAELERMLYDQALLAQAYMEAWQASGDPRPRAVSEGALAFVLRSLTGPEGEFHASIAAEAPGGAEAYWMWSVDEVRDACGEDADTALTWFDVSARGEVDGRNVLCERRSLAEVAQATGASTAEARAAVERCRRILLVQRLLREPPPTDERALAAWNGLMLSAFARAAAVYGEPAWLDAARRNGDFLLSRMRRADGGLHRVWSAGRAYGVGFLEDCAFVEQGLLDLYEADPDPRWLEGALALQEHVDGRYLVRRGGGYARRSDDELLPAFEPGLTEGSLPSPAGVAATNAARLGLLAGDRDLLDHARATLAAHAAELQRWPTSSGQALLLLDLLERAPTVAYVSGPAGDLRVRAELDRLRREWPPRRVFALIEPGRERELFELLPASAGRAGIDGTPSVWVRRGDEPAAPRALQ